MCLCAGFSSQAEDAISSQDWQFESNANPAVPTVATNSAGDATATIVVGFLGTGWQYFVAGLPPETGVWDLGFQDRYNLTNDTRGQVSLSIPNPIPPGGGSYTDLKVRLIQYVDGGIYTGDLEFSIPGGVLTGHTVVAPSPPFGNWVEYYYEWHLEPSPAEVFLTLTGAAYGTILDEIEADTDTPPAPHPLVIDSVVQSNQVLTITWEGGLAPYQVYITTNVADSESWVPLGPPVSDTTAQIPMTAPIGFVRVRGSNP
jgi:hypothetical protein